MKALLEIIIYIILFFVSIEVFGAWGVLIGFIAILILLNDVFRDTE